MAMAWRLHGASLALVVLQADDMEDDMYTQKRKMMEGGGGGGFDPSMLKNLKPG